MSMMCVDELRNLKDKLSVVRDDVLRREEDIAEGRVRIWVSDVAIKVIEADRLISSVVEKMPCPVNCYANELWKMQSELIALQYRAPQPGDFTVQGFENELKESFKCLIEDKVKLIGIWGMGGIGKTSLLTRIYYACLGLYDCVVWLQLSNKKAKVEELQAEFAKQIGKKILDGKRKILVLLDDLWHRVELQDIGISSQNCQVVFTTRSKGVCSSMEAQRQFQLKPLPWEKAWRLFKDRIGISAHETVARECAGLPLALVSCALSLSSSSIQSVHTLKNIAFRHVFSVLKSSYDSLPHLYMKSCLLYCALFPELFDVPKEELIDKWICEGFLDDFTEGYRVLEALVDLSLLEDECEVEAVRMHPLIRAMCFWLAREVEGEKQEFFVQSGKGPPIGQWENSRIISLMCNKGSLIHRLPPPPPHLSTLLLSRNPELGETTLVSCFISYTKSLTILDLSHTGLTVFPVEILELVSLQSLDISHTEIPALPLEIVQLERLRYFNLEFTGKLRFIPIQLLMKLKLLQVFRILGSKFILRPFFVDNLEMSDCLKAVSITVKDPDIYHIVLSIPNLSKCIRSLLLEDVAPPYGGFLGTRTESSYRICKTTHFESLQWVSISCCHYLEDLGWVTRAPNLRKLIVRYCENLREVSTESGPDSFAKIWELELIGLPNLKSICREPKLFPLLKVIRICGCPKLKKLPLNVDSAKGRNLVIEGTLDWWMELQWEDEAARTAFKSSYADIIWFDRRDGKCTDEDRHRWNLHRFRFFLP